jgi:hypothetical protein
MAAKSANRILAQIDYVRYRTNSRDANRNLEMCRLAPAVPVVLMRVI